MQPWDPKAKVPLWNCMMLCSPAMSATQTTATRVDAVTCLGIDLWIHQLLLLFLLLLLLAVVRNLGSCFCFRSLFGTPSDSSPHYKVQLIITPSHSAVGRKNWTISESLRRCRFHPASSNLKTAMLPCWKESFLLNQDKFLQESHPAMIGHLHPSAMFCTSWSR